jgi:2'-5' RNA ligase
VESITFRAFVSVDLSHHPAIGEFITELKQGETTLKVVDPAHMHITLKFMGETEEAKVPKIVEAMKGAVEGVEPFSLRFVGASSFPSKTRIRVVWVGIENPGPLGLIAGRLDESLANLGIDREARPFAPHLTVARARVEGPNPVVRQIIENHAQNDFGEERVDRILLKKSVLTRCGPQYSTVEEVKLG